MYQQDLGATQEEVDAAYARLSFSSDLAKAVENADLVIEAIPEVVKIKTEFYTNLGKVAPQKNGFCNELIYFIAKSICRCNWTT